MKYKYRIAEQYGKFRTEMYYENYYMTTFEIIKKFLGVYKKKYHWVSAVPQKFKTFQEAKDFIPKLESKYYDLEDSPKTNAWDVYSEYKPDFNKGMLEADKELQRISDKSELKYYVTSHNVKMEITKPYTFD